MASFVLAACVLLGSSRCPTSDELQSLETKHYVLHTTGSESARSELGRILEAAYAGFGEIYGRLPQRHERLAVVVFEDPDAWRAGLDARGLVPPEGLSDLWFRAEDQVLYTCGPLGAWQTRSLVLQGAWQQFHFACKKKNEDLVYNWYVTGIGLHVSMHRWDGERLQLGVLPRVAAFDLPEMALQDVGTGVLGLRRITDESLRSPPNAWAYVTYLLAGPEPAYRARFLKLALGRQGSMLSGDDFASTLGDPDSLVRDLERWLTTVQLPLRPVCGGWDDRDGDLVLGEAMQGQAVAVLKEAAREFEVRVDVGTARRVGILLDWTDEEAHEVAWLHDSVVDVFRAGGGHEEALAKRPVRGGKESSFVVRAEGDSQVLIVDGERVHDLARPTSRFGLCVEGGQARFRQLAWR